MTMLEDLLASIDTPFLVQTGILTIFCAIMPLFQTILIIRNKLRHPNCQRTRGETRTEHTLDYLKENYILLVRGALPKSKDHKHYDNIFEWLHITEMNTNNFKPQDRITLHEQMQKAPATESTPLNLSEHASYNEHDGDHTHTLQKVDVEKLGWLQDALDSKEKHPKDKDFVVQTPMMKVINHHLEMMKLTASIEHINFKMTLSKETQLKENQLPWKGTTDRLRKLSAVLPKAATNSAVRKMKGDMEWDKETMGNNLIPFNLIIKPWPSIQTQASSYLNSVMFDVWMHWFQIWYSLVVLNFILSG